MCSRMGSHSISHTPFGTTRNPLGTPETSQIPPPPDLQMSPRSTQSPKQSQMRVLPPSLGLRRLQPNLPPLICWLCLEAGLSVLSLLQFHVSPRLPAFSCLGFSNFIHCGRRTYLRYYLKPLQFVEVGWWPILGNVHVYSAAFGWSILDTSVQSCWFPCLHVFSHV